MNFDWNNLNLPTFDTDQEIKDRLNQLHEQAMKEKGLPTKVDKGSPGLRPDAQQARSVAVMTALGLAPKEIALALNIEEKTLKFYYTKELNVSHKIANLMVSQKALEMAMSGRYPDMTKFWLKARAGWAETAKVEVTGKDGGPVEMASARSKLAEAMGVGAAAAQTTDGDPAPTA